MLNFIKKWITDRQISEQRTIVEDVYYMSVALAEHFKIMKTFQGMAPNLFPTPRMSASDALTIIEEAQKEAVAIYRLIRDGQSLADEDINNLRKIWVEFHTTIRDIDKGLSRGIAMMGAPSADIVQSPMIRYKSLKNQNAIDNKF